MKVAENSQVKVARQAGRVRDAGMTMLEIMIVLAIIGLVMAAVGRGRLFVVQEGPEEDRPGPGQRDRAEDASST